MTFKINLCNICLEDEDALKKINVNILLNTLFGRIEKRERG